MLRYNGYDLRFDGEGRLVEASNATTGVRLVQYYDDAGERRIAIVERVGQAREVHRFVAPEYHIRDGEEVWFAGGGSVTAEIVRSKGVKMDAYLLDQLTAYVNGQQTKPKPLPAEYMDLNGDGIVMDEADLQIALEGYQNEERVGGEKLVWKYITSDHLGGATHITDSNGDLIGHTRFHAYGAVASRKGQRMWRGGYIGKDIEADADLGLQRIGARYYAPKLGRWVTPDPLIGQSPSLMVEKALEANLLSYGKNSPISSVDVLGQDVVTLHGGGPGGPSGVTKYAQFVQQEVLRRARAGKPSWAQPEFLPINNIEQNYDSSGTVYGKDTHDIPDKGMRHAEKYEHNGPSKRRPAAAIPRVLAGFSVGGDAALGAKGPAGGGKWDYRVVAGARTDGNFVEKLIAASKNSEVVVVVGIRGDVNLQNDKMRHLLPESALKRFGDRSYETAVAAIEERFGSVEKFNKLYPNVAIVPTDGEHGGGGACCYSQGDRPGNGSG